ncbi:MAG: S8 family peptidase [Ignavibacteria bacterium]|nr:S8 family peptidase [Ignavibacteria bacterium]
MKKFIVYFLIVLSSIAWSQGKVSENLHNYLSSIRTSEPIKIWVYFIDKGSDLNKYFINPELVVSKQSLERRKKVLPDDKLIDYDDLPVSSQYLNQLKDYVVEFKHCSKWFNAVSAYVLPEQINQIASLSFVKKVDLVEKFKKRLEPIEENNSEFDQQNKLNVTVEGTTLLNYGASLTQNQQINVVAVHNTGNYGQGVRICVMDAGFNRLTHEVFQNMNIIATWDFVNNRPYVGDGQGGAGSGTHGTQTLSTIGGFKEGQLIGPAFGATYILAKTENTESETPIEMDNWIRALEWADSIGVDVTSTSLGYLEFDPPYPSYNWTHMDGNTVPITIAADLAVKRGIVVVNSAGNEGYNATRNTLVAPADGDSVIAVGAVTSSGARASFSSVGNTVDGRIKPDVMAMGSGVRVASAYSDNGYTSASGTSFSCPLAAGVAALILSENPSLTPMQVRDAMRNTASNANSPNREMGWGILNALQAVNYYNINFSHTPPLDTTNVNGPYKIAAKITSRLGINSSSVKLFWGRGTITDSILMMEAPGDTFYAFIPGNGQSAIYKYYIEARTADGKIVKRHPKRAPQELLEFKVGNFASVSVNSGWNLMSVPVQTQNLTINQVFQNVTSSAYYFDGRYITRDTIVPGYGFWLKFSSNNNFSIPGNPLTAISLPVKAGWNLIGSLNTTIPVYTVSSVPPNIISTPFYGYNGGYFNSPQIERGKGYWVKVLQDGYLILNSSNKNNLNINFVDIETNKLVISDNSGNRGELIFSSVDYDPELPPIPPSNAFDVRFQDSKLTSTSDENLILLQGINSPLNLFLSPKSDLSLEFYQPLTNEFITRIKPGESKILELNNLNSLKVKVVREKLVYQLFQNYPNPFNSTTKIDFVLPENSFVKLIVYDVLGNEVLRLINQNLERGHYSINLDILKLKELSSGIYFYKLHAGNFVQTKKMIYLK